MPEENNSEPTAKKKRAVKRPAAKKSRKRAVKTSAAPAEAPAAEAPAAKSSAPPVTGDRLSEVARTIGSTVGGIVAKTKRALKRDGGNQ